MMNRKILFVLLSLLFVSASIYEVVAQQTGTRIKDVDNIASESVFWLKQPHEIKTILSLLQEGKKERAVKKARDYAASLENLRGAKAKQRRYYAFSALCAALTSS